MNLLKAIQSNITCRYYQDDLVQDEVLARVFDAARYAPNGGNRQPVRFIAVRNEVAKKNIGSLALFGDDAKGFDNMTQDDLALPFVRILGQLSPQVTAGDSK